MNADPLSRRLHLWSGLIFAAVFLAGFFAGGGVFTWLRPQFHPPVSRRQQAKFPKGPGAFLAELRELNLTPDQQRLAEAIVEKKHSAMESIVKETFPRMRAARDDMDRELHAILTDAQAKKFDEIRARRPDSSKGLGHFGRPGFSPPPGSRPPGPPPPGSPAPPTPPN